MKVCSKCVLDERFPGIRFGEDGVCDVCYKAGETEGRAEKARYEQKFGQLVQEHRGKSRYDCLVAYSGGKDSTYTLHLLKNRYDLRLLAFSFDNWFQSETADRNIQAVLRNMNIDHLTIRPSFDEFRRIVLASMSKDVYSVKSLARASAICTSCISLIRFAGFRMALDEEIPFLAFGMSPGQASLATAVVKTNARMIRSMQEALLGSLVPRAGEFVRRFFLEERHFAKAEAFPYSINPLAFTDYDEEVIFRIAGTYGWKKPADTDANSTNCLLNAFANQIHVENHGVNPYTYEIAVLVRIGCITRAEGLKRLAERPPTEQVRAIQRKLGIASC